MKNLSVLADEVLRSVEADSQTKEAAEAPAMKTDVGALMSKLASELRTASTGKITYTDLARFRKTYAV